MLWVCSHYCIRGFPFFCSVPTLWLCSLREFWACCFPGLQRPTPLSRHPQRFWTLLLDQLWLQASCPCSVSSPPSPTSCTAICLNFSSVISFWITPPSVFAYGTSLYHSRFDIEIFSLHSMLWFNMEEVTTSPPLLYHFIGHFYYIIYHNLY